MVFCGIVSSLGSFSLGWTIGSPNIVGRITHDCSPSIDYTHNSVLPDCIPMSTLLWGFAVSSYCLGGLVASLLAGTILNRIGRKKTISLNNLGWLIGAVLIALSTSPVMFVFGRIFCGLSCGLGSVATPTYNGEISTTRGRGTIGTLNQLFIVIGILSSNLVGLVLATVPMWRVSYALVILPALLQMVMMPFCVESPRYLISKNRIDEAKNALQRLRGKCLVDGELSDIIAGQLGVAATLPESSSTLDLSIKKVSTKEVVAESPQKFKQAYSIRDLFNDPVVFQITCIVMVLHATQQLSAVNGVMYYSTTIFDAAFDQQTSMYIAIATSGVNLVVSLLSAFLIDHVGRRFLLILAMVGGCVTGITLALGGYFQQQVVLVVSVFLFVSSFAIGLGSIPWMITSELAPTHAASSVGAVATSINWASNFVIGLLFPTLLATLHSFAFLIFSAILLLATIYTIVYVPETKGRSLEEINASFERRIRYGISNNDLKNEIVE
ncbi:general substrate transporter [Radiomyces spectabilis]|uniref:general substrate transporter n=1 Tax=Radiomyces spectabilis TaxID=64574 RepID=UPI00221FF78C|nr:general substrate transporter [Radiomyces spectabilis]KAI8374272.1 general substrate transporter [Radiomyces spectabilis]